MSDEQAVNERGHNGGSAKGEARKVNPFAFASYKSRRKHGETRENIFGRGK